MKTNPLVVYLPDTRGISISPFGRGNAKIGPSVFTYSRVAGQYTVLGTCPGSTPECEDICYAKRINGPVRDQYMVNSLHDDVDPIPDECRLLRIHVSGDFNTKDYILNWYRRIVDRPDITVWAYTRSWRVPELLPALELLRALPHVQLFASMDRSTTELPPLGWRVAWIDGDTRLSPHRDNSERRDCAWVEGPVTTEPQVLHDVTIGYVCPEETGRKSNCEECRYCFDGQEHDVIFLKH